MPVIIKCPNAACAKQAVAEQEGSGAHAKAAGMVAEVMCSVEALKR